MILQGRNISEEDIEVSVFGPGYGESVLIGIGGHYWICIDSCKETPRARPMPIEYLLSLGVDVSTDLKVLIATHWHDDHISGLSEILSIAKNAGFFCPVGMNENVMGQLISAYNGTRQISSRPGTSEIYKALKYLSDNNIYPRLIGEASILLKQPSPAEPRIGIELMALSPSSYAVSKCLLAIGRYLEGLEGPVTALPAPKENLLSSAICLSIGEYRVLFGADLEYRADPRIGWIAVCNLGKHVAIDKSSTYKVAHHGAASGDGPRIWSELLSDDPICIVTPWRLGGNILPSGDDIDRLRMNSSQVYLSTHPFVGKNKYDQTTNKTLRDFDKHIERYLPAAGHIRMRSSLHSLLGTANSSWAIEMSTEAELVGVIP
jgi:hypothetical protein